MLVGKFNDCTESCVNILIRHEKNNNGMGEGGLSDKSGYGCPNNICNDCLKIIENGECSLLPNTESKLAIYRQLSWKRVSYNAN